MNAVGDGGFNKKVSPLREALPNIILRLFIIFAAIVLLFIVCFTIFSAVMKLVGAVSGSGADATWNIFSWAKIAGFGSKYELEALFKLILTGSVFGVLLYFITRSKNEYKK